MKKLTLLLSLISIVANAQLERTSFEALEEKMQEEPRPVLVFIHTNWCKFCKMMEKRTFQDEEVVDLLNENFYFVALDAEQEKDIPFRGKTFEYVPNGPNTGLHELAWQLGEINGQIGYPTLTMLNPQYEIIFQKADTFRIKAMKKLLSITLREM